MQHVSCPTSPLQAKFLKSRLQRWEGDLDGLVPTAVTCGLMFERTNTYFGSYA